MPKQKLPSKYCNACCSIGCPQLCELKAGHKGKHKKTGDVGKPGKPVKFVLTWTSDFYDNEVYEVRKQGLD
jgi:hypothetical protein